MVGCRAILLCSVMALCLSFDPAAAEMPDHEEPILTTDEIVISETRTPEETGKSAAAVTVL